MTLAVPSHSRPVHSYRLLKSGEGFSSILFYLFLKQIKPLFLTSTKLLQNIFKNPDLKLLFGEHELSSPLVVGGPKRGKEEDILPPSIGPPPEF